MLICDLNCDMGEGIGNDEAIMPYITSANISCGFHAGNGDTIRESIALALRHNVRIGAHPSFRDKENFGRKEMHLGQDKLYAIVLEQLIKMDLIAKEKGAKLYHVKPHGALYNMAAKDAGIAGTIALAIKDFNEDLVLYGLSNSCLISEGKALGLQTANEVFADRTYQEDGSLTPRSQEDALIEDEEQCLQQVMQMIKQGTVTAISGKNIPIAADTICIHSDGKHAVSFAKKIYEALKQSAPETN
ncbi:MAG TPA: 5-oxoprolinase subunit PxpA [Flavisolibacter sp.]|nr:5-oxoprolinase subunit PxpA [Flavisolibacter sp.]